MTVIKKEEKNLPFAEDNCVASFQLEGAPVHGRVARFGSVINDILSAHAYPEAAARLLGEALLAISLIGSRLKFKGKLVLQAQGDGPVSLFVADYTSAGTLRGFIKSDHQALAALQGKKALQSPPSLKVLLGKGMIALTLSPEDAQEHYQSIVTRQGETLAEAFEAYFQISEQMPTRMALAMAQHDAGDGRLGWRGGGMLLQHYPDAREEKTGEAWTYATTLFDTLKDEELVDPDVSAGRLLHRLFHEEGVRLAPPSPLINRCSCSREKIARLLASFPESERVHLIRDGKMTSHCEYCNRVFSVSPEDIEAEVALQAEGT